MENRIQLLHPEGKNAFKIDVGKYDVISKAITQCLNKQALTHKEMHEAVNIEIEIPADIKILKLFNH